MSGTTDRYTSPLWKCEHPGCTEWAGWGWPRLTGGGFEMMCDTHVIRDGAEFEYAPVVGPELPPVVTQYVALVVEGRDGARYYQHVDAVHVGHYTSELLRFAGDRSHVITTRYCTESDHVSGVQNCKYGES